MRALHLRAARAIIPIFFGIGFAFAVFYAYTVSSSSGEKFHFPSIISPKPADRRPPTTRAPPRYKPTPTWAPKPVTDPFPLLATSTATPPPIPDYNVPRPNLHKEYGLDRPPPLFIGFTRQWGMLLQAVVSYITAGWPASNIYVVENTGVHNSNRDGKLSLQNPFYLNHTTLKRLGVHVVQTPVLFSFSQLQNFFLDQAYQNGHPYYFYSHQDVIVLSFEDGSDNNHRPGDRKWEYYDKEDEDAVKFPKPVGHPEYRTIYENCLRDLSQAVQRQERWGMRWYQYDHLTLVNREAMEAVGGYDSWIPYYISDCDINSKLTMDGWTMTHRRVGFINDVSTVLTDLGAFYRIPTITPNFTDPNPLTPEEEAKIREKIKEEEKKKAEAEAKKPKGDKKTAQTRRNSAPEEPLAYFRKLNKVALDMGWYKYRDGDKQRNRWQISQRGGLGEPFYYDALGFGQAFAILTEAGKEVYRQKWGHRDCDLADGTALRLEDQWRVEKDWEKPKENKGG